MENDYILLKRIRDILFFIFCTCLFLFLSLFIYIDVRAESNESNFYFKINNTFTLGTRNYIWLSANENMRLNIKNDNVYNNTGGVGVFPLDATSGYIGLCVSNLDFNIPYFDSGSGLRNVQFFNTDNTCSLFNYPNNNKGKIVYFVFDIELFTDQAWSYGTQTYNWVNNNNVSITWTNYYGTDIGLYSYGFGKDRFYPSADTSGTTNAVKQMSAKIDTTHGILNTIKSAITNVIAAITNLPNLIWNVFSSAFTTLFGWLSDIFDSVKDIMSNDTPTNEWLSNYITNFPGINDNLVAQIITLPIHVLTKILGVNTCAPVILGSLYGTTLTLPCLGTTISNILGGLINVCGWMVAFYIYYLTFVKVKDVLFEMMTLEGNIARRMKIKF